MKEASNIERIKEILAAHKKIIIEIELEISINKQVPKDLISASNLLMEAAKVLSVRQE